jgi:glycosyltransferase involved in cell wall biosynthesis
MNIVMIGPFGLKPKGTLSVRALPMAQVLVARGHSVTLLIPPWDHPADAGREWEEGGVRVVNVPLPPRLPLLFHGWLALRLVWRALALNPDVIHCFKPKAYAGLAHLAFWGLRRTGLAGKKLSPSVRLVVDEDDWEQAWNAVEPYSPVQKWVFAWQEGWGLTYADAVVVASRALASLVEGAGVPPARIHYVPNGVRPSLVDEEDHQSSSTLREEHRSMSQGVRTRWKLDNAPVVLLYTRFFEFRLERIVEILRRVVGQVPKARLLIVGQGLFGEETQLDERLKAAGLSDRVVFTGWVEADQLPGYFAASDVAIFPYDDTLINRTKCSVKLVDLLAAGLPVVADRVGQNAEYIVDGVSGLLVAPEDDAAFAEAVVRLLSDGDHRARLGAAAAGRVQEHFAWDRLAEGVERAYRWTT